MWILGMNKPIIFLDIDGVMRNGRSKILESGQSFHDRVFDPVNIAYLKRLVEISNAGVVISSMWKEPNAHYMYLNDSDKEIYKNKFSYIKATSTEEWYNQAYKIFAENFYDIKEFILSKFPDWKPPLEDDWFVMGYYRLNQRPGDIENHANKMGYTRWIMLDDFGDCDHAKFVCSYYPRAIYCDPHFGFNEPEYRRSLMFLNVKDEERYGPNWGWETWTELGDPDSNQNWLNDYLNRKIAKRAIINESIWDWEDGPMLYNENKNLHHRFDEREKNEKLLNSFIV